MNFTEISTYFRVMAESHILIQHTEANKHFFADHEEAIDGLRDSLNCPAVILGPPEFIPYEYHRDNQQETNSITLLIVDKVTPEDFAGKKTAMDRCKSIATDFVSRLIRDEHNQENIIAFEANNCSIDPVGPILDNFYGVSLNIEFNTIQSLEYEPDNWID